jgi:RNA polymerase sigma factor (sigma-70 family)
MDHPSATPPVAVPADEAHGHDPTSRGLLLRARAGDSRALSALVRRHLPSLRRWAHGRLPAWLRAAADTGDLVQTALLQTIRRLNTFEPRAERALGAYLRQAVINQIRDEHRRFSRRGAQDPLPDTFVDGSSSPFDEASYAQLKNRYRTALGQLGSEDQRLVVAHVELGYTHEQLGCMTGKKPDTARVALRRALNRLAEAMRRADP